MIGVILSGGQSTRMGQDKGLMEFQGKLWTERVREKLVSLSIPTIISINKVQLLHYVRHFNQNDLVIDHSGLPIEGPLKGLMSVHLKYPEEDLLAIACDMIRMESVVLGKLLHAFDQEQPEAMAFRGETVEPLCAVYSAKGLKKIPSIYNSQKGPTNYSLKHVLESLKTTYLPIEKEWLSSFKNFNREKDLDN